MSEPRKMLLLAIVAIVSMLIWAYAGFLCGLAKGRGWRGAMVESGCAVTCPDGSRTR